MPTIDIIITKRAHDYHASVEPGLWESGKTEAEAIGKLIQSCSRACFGIALIREEEQKSARAPKQAKTGLKR